MTKNRKTRHERLPSVELFNYADQFKFATLWNTLGETQLYAVQSGDETLYCRVQEKNGLVVYPGQKGLLSYMKMHHLLQDGVFADWKLFESAFSEDCVKCTFEDRRTLDDWDYRCIVGLGRSYRGKQSWPKFRRYYPLRYPWYIDERDEKLLIEALKAACYFAEMLENKSYLELISSRTGQALNSSAYQSENVLSQGHVPMLVASSEVEMQPYQITIKALQDIDELFKAPILSNELDIIRLRSVRNTEEILQCAITCLPMSIEDEAGGAPHISLAFVMVAVQDMPTKRTAKIVAIDIAMDYESSVENWISKFCGYIYKKGKPLEVIANEYRTDHFLKRLCGQLGIKYRYVKGPLQELNDGIAGLSEQMAKGYRDH